MSPRDGDSNLKVLYGPGLTDSTLLGEITMVLEVELLATLSSPPGFCMPSQQRSYTSPGISQATHVVEGITGMKTPSETTPSKMVSAQGLALPAVSGCYSRPIPTTSCLPA